MADWTGPMAATVLPSESGSTVAQTIQFEQSGLDVATVVVLSLRSKSSLMNILWLLSGFVCDFSCLRDFSVVYLTWIWWRQTKLFFFLVFSCLNKNGTFALWKGNGRFHRFSARLSTWRSSIYDEPVSLKISRTQSILNLRHRLKRIRGTLNQCLKTWKQINTR